MLHGRRHGRCAIRGHPDPVLTHTLFLKIWLTKITPTRRPVSFGVMTMLNEPLQLSDLTYWRSSLDHSGVPKGVVWGVQTPPPPKF